VVRPPNFILPCHHTVPPRDLAFEADIIESPSYLLQHERIVCLLGASLAPPHLCLVEELALGGSLYDLLHTGNRKKGLPYKQARSATLSTDISPVLELGTFRGE